jgi:hypothetical protein
MRITIRKTIRSLAGCVSLGFAVAALSGCQTYFGGMTLPSGHYLKHRPQYFPPDPAFPLQREVDSMQDPDGLLRRAPGAAAIPAIAPVGPVGNPQPAAGMPGK